MRIKINIIRVNIINNHYNKYNKIIKLNQIEHIMFIMNKRTFPLLPTHAIVLECLCFQFIPIYDNNIISVHIIPYHFNVLRRRK